MNIDITAQSLSVLNINITSSSITLNIKTTTGEHVDTDIVSSITLNVDITAQTVGNIGVDIKAQTIGNIGVSINASLVTMQVNLYSSSITLNVDITAQTVGNIGIDIKAQTLGTVNINITSQSGAININTLGGTNIVIDKLTQTAYLDRHSTVSNNGTVVAYDDITGVGRYAKFFPRGVRGYISTIQLYCKDNGASGGTITVYVAPYIGAGYLYSGTITVGAGASADWRSYTFNRMWNYDSIFIFWVTSSADIQVGYDTGSAYDGYWSGDSGLTFTVHAWRFHVRLNYFGQTIGDLPVSGIINNVPLPNKTSTCTKTGEEVSASATVTLLTVYGMGIVKFVCFYCAHGNMIPSVYADGVLSTPEMEIDEMNTRGYTSGSFGIQVTRYNATSDCDVIMEIEIPFQKKVEFKIENKDVSARYGYVWPCVQLLA